MRFKGLWGVADGWKARMYLETESGACRGFILPRRPVQDLRREGRVTTLDLSGVSVPKVGVEAGFRFGWLRHIGIVMGGASGAAIVLGAYNIMTSQPHRDFALLQGWGPSFLIAIVALFVVGKFLEGMTATVRESFSLVASGVHSSAEASGRTADALTRLADHGSRQAEQVERLAIYAAQEFPGMYERFDRQDETLQDLTRSVNAIRMSLGSADGGRRDGSGS